MTLLIVDGMDRSGKDTLVRALVKGRKTTRPLHVFHNMAPPAALGGKDARDYHLEVYLTQLELARDMDAHDFVVNRSWLSEQVYGHAYRGQPAALSGEWMASMRDALRQQDHLVVMLTADPARVVRRDDGDSTFKGDSESARAELKLFEAAYDQLAAPGVRRLSFHETDPAVVLKVVAEALGW